jgi:hypothetical protein
MCNLLLRSLFAIADPVGQRGSRRVPARIDDDLVRAISFRMERVRVITTSTDRTHS